MNARDLAIRYTTRSGQTSTITHRVWSAERLLQSKEADVQRSLRLAPNERADSDIVKIEVV